VRHSRTNIPPAVERRKPPLTISFYKEVYLGVNLFFLPKEHKGTKITKGNQAHFFLIKIILI